MLVCLNYKKRPTLPQRHFLHHIKLSISCKFYVIIFERDQSDKRSPNTKAYTATKAQESPDAYCPISILYLILPTTASLVSRCQDKDGPSGEPLGKGENEKKWTKSKASGSVQREQIYILINKSTIHGFWDSFWAEQWSTMEGRKKEKKKDANVNRKFGIMKWSQSPGKRWEAIILLVRGWREVVFPYKHWGNKCETQWETTDSYLQRHGGRQRMDAEINKWGEKKKMHFCNFVYQHDYFAWLSFLQALSWRQGC